MTKANVLGISVVGGFSLLAAVLAGCGSQAGVNEPEATSRAAVTSAATIAAGDACHSDEGARCEKGYFCDVTTTDGVCGTAGVCTVEPTFCSDIAPLGGVCGCDGNDYLNSCAAQKIGVTVAHAGPCRCEPKPDGNASEICASGFNCQTTVSSRGSCASRGTCVAQPPCSQLCSQQAWCGCDGVTYDGCNECLDERAAGVSMAYEGACK
jgi:hypothetical protein